MKILFTLIFAIILFVVYVRYLEESTIFIPDRQIANSPRQIGLNYDDVYFNVSDTLKLNGWFVEASPDSSRHPTVIFFHGNAGNIGDRLDKIRLFHTLGVNTFIYDYRGYGNSEGKSTEQNMYTDALDVYDYVVSREDVDSTKIIIYGASLGGAPAVELASKRKVSGVIIDSSFSNAVDMAKVIFPIVPAFLIKSKLDSLGKVKEVSSPMLFVHSKDDRTVPIGLGKKLYDAVVSPKEFVVIGGDHNDGHIASAQVYLQAFENFFKKYSLL